MEPNDCHNCEIRSLALFGEISSEGVDQFAEQTYQVQYPAGATIYEQGDKPEAAFTLREGIIKLVRNPGTDRSQIVRLLVKGDLMGIEGIFEEPYRQSAIALTPVRVCYLPLPMLDRMRTEEPRFTEALLGRWRRALNEVEELAVELGTRKAEERVAAFLLHWQEKAEHDDDDWMPFPLSRTELGQMLGLRVETVSRVLARWKREGIFEERSSRLRLLEPDCLDQLLAQGTETATAAHRE
ncbi:Crp/Fnr family transcriptional regulator [Halorhodospira halochloris]|uniref:Crp/Fnr family transcriptional regulator n=1 Tax=Halorhodospira halochloris TaxID=1052 RepID=UPI001EE7F994|nr:Crp/Fnr family transcriptional regulator [Halorhodospira halochloris]MCG5530689.1 Crp/Fnr family transcriptional regulator [Halorhodospira halochloris]